MVVSAGPLRRHVLGCLAEGRSLLFMQDAGRRLLAAADAPAQATDLTVDIGVTGSAAQRVGDAMSAVVNQDSLRVSLHPCR
jgi:hypothetical protein